MTIGRLAEIEARFKAACPKVDRGGEELKMTVAQSRAVRPWANGAQILYADNDLCAEVCSNSSLNADRSAIAEFFAHALVDVRDLINAVKESTQMSEIK